MPDNNRHIAVCSACMKANSVEADEWVDAWKQFVEAGWEERKGDIYCTECVALLEQGRDPKAEHDAKCEAAENTVNTVLGMTAAILGIDPGEDLGPESEELKDFRTGMLGLAGLIGEAIVPAPPDDETEL